LDPARDDRALPVPPDFVWEPRPKFTDRIWRHLLLFVLTIFTTTLVGIDWYVGFLGGFTNSAQLTWGDLLRPDVILPGFWYSGTILAILGCHELGHYLACRYYDVDASLPFFIPAPLPLTGTLGAFIRIREPIPTKWMLFDIGVAGPIAGFLVAVPALFIGLSMSTILQVPTDIEGLWLGEPLLFQAAAKLLWGTPPEGYSLNMHPMAFAAWFGLLATALNLVPIGQLDGGHICYAVLGRRSSYITLLMIALAVVLTAFVSTSWLVWTILMVVMLIMFGPHHPRTFDENVPLDRRRVLLAIVALIMFIICFTPAPIEPMELIGR
jgi:membrane-associated protease RseP (regulator of RpoE activity)